MISGIAAPQLSLNRLIAVGGGSMNPRAADSVSSEQSVRPGPDAVQRTSGTGKTELTEEERKQVQELQERDREVRQHEQAHKAAAGRYAAGGPTYTYEQGPDGRRYAVEGEVQIDTSPVEGDPQATIQKARQIRRAALAPAQPSAQDRQVAAKAAQLERQAQAEAASGEGRSEGSTRPGEVPADDSDDPRAKLRRAFDPTPPATGQFINALV